jgi:hypothetical protein
VTVTGTVAAPACAAKKHATSAASREISVHMADLL